MTICPHLYEALSRPVHLLNLSLDKAAGQEGLKVGTVTLRNAAAPASHSAGVAQHAAPRGKIHSLREPPLGGGCRRCSRCGRGQRDLAKKSHALVYRQGRLALLLLR